MPAMKKPIFEFRSVYMKCNWSEYYKALENRGSINFWFFSDAIKNRKKKTMAEDVDGKKSILGSI